MNFRHLILSSCVFLIACGGGTSSSSGGSGQSVSPPPPPPPPPPPVSKTLIDNVGEASRLISLAGLGESYDDLEALVGDSAEDWIKNQLSTTYTPYLNEILARKATYPDTDFKRQRSHKMVFWKRMISAEDQMRHRMVNALSQIVVASDIGIGSEPEAMGFYMDALGRNAFGNYKTLLTEVTYTPAMGEYLTYLNNRKADEQRGTMPDENYAREFMQLFTIGLHELNMDGTQKLDGQGEPIPTYSNADIAGLARVFTGLRYDQLDGADRVTAYQRPMRMQANRHSEKEKTFLGQTIPANTDGTTSIAQAIDIIFDHPNVAPFISRQLIQRFTASNPEPAYVERVATAFETGIFTGPDGTVFGNTGRGDLSATLAALLLDESLLNDSYKTLGSGDLTDLGKVREPALNFVHWARAFDVSPVLTELEGMLIWGTNDPSNRLAQDPFSSVSVFNFYRPGFIASGTEAGDLQLTVPELQIVNSGSRNGYLEFMTYYVFDQTYLVDNRNDVSFQPDYADLIALDNNVPAMIEHLDGLLTYGRMTAATKTNITELLAEIPVRTDNAQNTANDKTLRAQLAVLLAVSGPSFQTQQ